MDKKSNGRKCKEYARSFATHPRAANWSNENSVSPSEVFLNCTKKFYFDCECGHTIRKVLRDVTYGQWCSYCSHQKLCENNACQKCRENSFASHPKSIHWSPKNAVTPRMVFLSSGKSYQFDCPCGHEFPAPLSNVFYGQWCPYCSHQKLCENNACQKCRENSFASHPKSAHWSAKNAVTPRMVFKCSDEKYVFNCPCGHEFPAPLSNVSYGQWCPYCCVPPKKLCENDACQKCQKNSFASHPRSIHWSAKNAVSPRMVFKCSNEKYVFNCDAGHEFKAQVTNVTCKNSQWCPDCYLKTEAILHSYLKQEYGANTVERNVSFDWCVWQLTNRKCRFDFYMKTFALIIELDGEQHFSQVFNWKSPEESAEIDRFKMQCALNKRVSVVRLLQEDVLFDRIDWRMHLKNAIKRYEFPSCVFICEDKEKYKNHTIATVELDRSPLKIPDIGDLDIIAELFLE